ncbi:MAG: translation initiation factor IF-2 [Deltaproteobacteria bacterium]|nr:translation initiation factor IF-2 [Deltaproteobacteria bacterium]
MAQKIRVFQLAREFGLENDVMVVKIQNMGLDARNYMSALDVEDAQRVRRQMEKEREENTFEEHIRPTVVRRRTKAGAPAPNPAARKKAAAKPEPESKPTRKKAAAKQEVAEVLSEAEAQAAAEREMAVSAELEATFAQEESAAPGALVEDEEMGAQAEPDERQTEAGAQGTTAEVLDGARPSGVVMARGPAVLRPASQAPVIKRRMSAVPSPARKPATREEGITPAPGGTGGVPSAAAGEAAPGVDSGKGHGPAARRREVESREIASGRFTGVGPGKFGSAPPGRKRRMAPGKKGKKTEITTPKASKRVIRIEENVSLQELAKRMGVKATEVLMKLLGLGMGGVNINSSLDSDTAKIIASDFGYEVENVAVAEDALLASTRSEESDEEKRDRVTRPPVVTMMGHVDHGKTSLLDAIRKSDVVSTEAGGITQHIGAYRVKTPTGTVAFIDTPGHAAFTAMRARGASVTDIVVLVVAADDGVMLQTVEAISHARAAGVPIIVAINKCDLPGANPERTRRMLLEQGLVPEELGGDTIMLEVSAKTGQGLDRLLEMLSLQSEVMELSTNPNRPASGVVLEAYLDKGRGPVANVLVQDGTLKVGDAVVAGNAWGKVRALTDDHGRKVNEAEPATPVEILGLSAVPGAGDSFDVVQDMKLAEKVAKSRTDRQRATSGGAARPSLEALYQQMQGSDQVELKIIVKGDVQGTVGALIDALQKLSTEKVKVGVVHSSVGGITESDVMLASTSGAIVIGFNVRPAGKARQLAEEQGVEISLFSIIYEVVDAVKKAMVGLLAPTMKEEIVGQVEVRNIFSIPKIGTVAGSYVTDGKVVRTGRVRLIRESVQIWEGKIGSLRRFKDDAKEVGTGFECGICLDGYNDVKVGDVIEVYLEKEVQATLN